VSGLGLHGAGSARGISHGTNFTSVLILGNNALVTAHRPVFFFFVRRKEEEKEWRSIFHSKGIKTW